MDVKQDVDYIERNPIASRRQLHPLRGHECNGKASAKRSKRESHEKKKEFFFFSIQFYVTIFNKLGLLVNPLSLYTSIHHQSSGIFTKNIIFFV